MNFWNNPAYQSIKVFILVIVIAVAGYFVFANIADREVSQEGKVLTPVKAPTGDIMVEPTFAELCADGNPHIRLNSPNNGDYKITSNLSLTWETCNIGNAFGESGRVSLTLLYDPMRTWAYITTGDKTPSAGQEMVDDGNQSVSILNFNGGYGGFYKAKLTVAKAVKEVNGQDPGDFDIVYEDVASDQSDNWLMLYEKDSYVMGTGTELLFYDTQNDTFPGTNPQLQYFRIPKNKTNLTFKAAGAGGSAGQNGQRITENSGANFKIYAGGGGGGSGAPGESISSTFSNVFAGGLLEITLGQGGHIPSALLAEQINVNKLDNKTVKAPDGTLGVAGGSTKISGSALNGNSPITLSGGAGGKGGIGLGYLLDPDNYNQQWYFGDGGAGGIGKIGQPGGKKGAAGYASSTTGGQFYTGNPGLTVLPSNAVPLIRQVSTSTGTNTCYPGTSGGFAFGSNYLDDSCASSVSDGSNGFVWFSW